jgi:hypothetical protein
MDNERLLALRDKNFRNFRAMTVERTISNVLRRELWAYPITLLCFDRKGPVISSSSSRFAVANNVPRLDPANIGLPLVGRETPRPQV